MSVTTQSAEASRSARAPSPLAAGVMVWLTSELMFFAGLFAAYFAIRGVNDPWPPAEVELATARTALATGVLIASSGTMHLAVEASRGEDREHRRRAVAWLAVTALLGAVFLANQALEYAEANFQVDDHAYGTIFYTLTGFHGLHVLGGLAFIGVSAFVVAGRSRAPSYPSVEVCGYYWHFVDVVWVALFVIVYLVT